jgi:hypothetical protein
MELLGFVLIAIAPLALIPPLASSPGVGRRGVWWARLLFGCVVDLAVSAGGGLLSGSLAVALGAAVLAYGGGLLYLLASSAGRAN